MLAAEFSLSAMRTAGVRRCVMIIADRKTELVRYFSNGAHVGVSIAYVDQPEPLGLAAAIDSAFDWVTDCGVCLALPDTIFSPRDALARVVEMLVDRDADVVLGVFPTSEPQRLAPVRIGPDDRVLEVLEKPASSELGNTWGVAAWTATFSEFLHSSASRLRDRSISHVFDDAVKQGLDVRAVWFPEGRYLDLGTVDNLAALVLQAGLIEEASPDEGPLAAARGSGKAPGTTAGE